MVAPLETTMTGAHLQSSQGQTPGTVGKLTKLTTTKHGTPENGMLGMQFQKQLQKSAQAARTLSVIHELDDTSG